MRLPAEKRIDPTKNAHGIALTDTDASWDNSIGFPENIEIAFLTKIPAPTIIIGMKIAHINPIMDCLYLIFISRHTSIESK